ncbi:hypothetical protein HMPREF0322_02896 [Desulfitobacterium hafniense DP7]|uniref:Uncharacterized protein n=1 Tax=Desulfitobacterium hafniense DP7 TaxID=537010 RepID=G9XPK0_DESHA|nr:hypothetical protein HMPREF0322_02896 [Desulfitobacterium hafniense DP7]
MLLGVKDEGDLQWHAGDTLFRGGLSSWLLLVTAWGMNLH